MLSGRAIPHCPGPQKLVLFQRELANLSLVWWLLEQQGPAPSQHKASHTPCFPGNATARQTLRRTLASWDLPLSPSWQTELMAGTTLAPLTYRFMEQRIEKSFSSSRGHEERAERPPSNMELSQRVDARGERLGQA